MTELLGHLRFEAQKDLILKTSNCIPCMMPYITSQFMPRVKGDRPPVKPPGTTNLAFIGNIARFPRRRVHRGIFGALGADRRDCTARPR